MSLNIWGAFQYIKDNTCDDSYSFDGQFGCRSLTLIELFQFTMFIKYNNINDRNVDEDLNGKDIIAESIIIVKKLMKLLVK